MPSITIKRKTSPLLAKLVKASKAGKAVVKVGFPASQASQSNINKAIWNEFGTKGSGKPFATERGGGFGGPIPERPFMRNTMRENGDRYSAIMRDQAWNVLTGKVTVTATLENLGKLVKSDIEGELISLKTPPNSPTTIRLKGSSNPLTDTGEMQQAISWIVQTA